MMMMKMHLLVVAFALGAAILAAGSSEAGDIKVHASKRYYQDAAAKPFFFIGAYCWASVAPGYYNDSPQRYVDMIAEGAKMGVNYVRFSLGINALGGKGTEYWEKDPTPTPFVYVNGKVDLDQWNKIFWEGLVYHATWAKEHGVFLHVCLFDGVDIRGGDQAHRWINSYYNIKNQTRDFFGNLDTSGDGNTDERGEFYRINDFKNNTGVGVYQRRIIDKALELTKSFDNVFYEIGNEMLDSDRAWNQAVVDYVKSKSGKAITQCGGQLAPNAEGFSDHGPNTPADVKRMVAKHVGTGKPFWLDPDGSKLGRASADDLRRAIWYSFTGGAAGWGGFGGYWRKTVDPAIREYYGYVGRFVKESECKFWEMTPRHELASNPEVNSCIAKDGEEYIVYVLSDESVTVDLTALKGKAVRRIFDPKLAKWSMEMVIEGGSKQTFNKPAGADDWVIHIARQPESGK